MCHKCEDVVVMDAVELVIPIDVTKSKLMGSDVLIGARVCSSDGDVRDSDSVSNKIDECTSLLAHRGELLLCLHFFMMLHVYFSFPTCFFSAISIVLVVYSTVDGV